MISAPLVAIYLGYLMFLVGFFVFSAFALYHLDEFGHVGDFCRPMTYLYVGAGGVIMLATVVLLLAI